MNSQGIRRACIAMTVFGLCLPAATALAEADWYVDCSVQESGEGDEWGEAFKTLQEALTDAIAQDVIWVAQGTYYPSERRDSGDPRSATFHMAQGVKIYGGFEGDETLLEQRDIYAFPTILSGDLDQDDTYGSFPDDIWDDRTDNAYHVIWGSATANPMLGARLDGFTIIGGTADGTEQKWGGGYAVGGDMIVRCTFAWNRAKEGGGAILSNANVIVYNCRFYNNLAGAIESMSTTDRSAVVALDGDSSHIIDCTFQCDRPAD